VTTDAEGSEGSEAGAEGTAGATALAGSTIAVAGGESGVCRVQATSDANAIAAAAHSQFAFIDQLRLATAKLLPTHSKITSAASAHESAPAGCRGEKDPARFVGCR
jgi:hypothetical protein